MRFAIRKEMNFALGALVGKSVVEIRYVMAHAEISDLALLGVGIATEAGTVPAPWLEEHVRNDASLLTEMISHARDSLLAEAA